MDNARTGFIEQQLVDHLFTGMRWTIPVTLVPLAIIIGLLYGLIPDAWLGIWAGYMITLELAMMGFAQARLRARWTLSPPAWLRGYTVLHLMASVGWAAGASSFMVPVPHWEALILGLCAIGISIGSLNGMSWQWLTYGFGIACILMPVGVWLSVIYTDTSLRALGLGCLILSPLLTLIAWLDSRGRVRLIASEYEKRQLENLRQDQATRLTDVQRAHSPFHEADPLTRLPSVATWKAALAYKLGEAPAGSIHYAIFFIDIKDFRKINQRWGNAAGDTVIHAIAERLQRLSPRRQTCHLSADEFLLFLAIDSQQHAEELAGKLARQLKSPVSLGEREVRLSPTIGIAMYPEHGSLPEALIDRASLANYHNKRDSDTGFAIFRPQLAEATRRRIDIELALKDAIGRQELDLVYQPQVNIADGRIVGAEALLRWQNADLGAVSPCEFIPIAERTGLIIPLGNWVIERVCRDLATWRRRMSQDLHVALNVSPMQLTSGETVQQLRKAIERYDLLPPQLHVEITETAIMDNPKAALEEIRTIRALGIPVALDDFGTGFSSLGYLKNLEIDYLKLDQSFISGVNSSRKDWEITRSVIAMARALGLKVVAEGVETDDIWHIMQDQGCDFGQGWLFGKPVSDIDYLRLVGPTASEVSHPNPA